VRLPAKGLAAVRRPSAGQKRLCPVPSFPGLAMLAALFSRLLGGGPVLAGEQACSPSVFVSNGGRRPSCQNARCAVRRGRHCPRVCCEGAGPQLERWSSCRQLERWFGDDPAIRSASSTLEGVRQALCADRGPGLRPGWLAGLTPGASSRDARPQLQALVRASDCLWWCSPGGGGRSAGGPRHFAGMGASLANPECPGGLAGLSPGFGGEAPGAFTMALFWVFFFSPVAACPLVLSLSAAACPGLDGRLSGCCCCVLAGAAAGGEAPHRHKYGANSLPLRRLGAPPAPGGRRG